MSIVDFLGKRVPFGGGGYFRLYPVALTRHFIRKINKLGYPCMFYIHPYEAGPVIPTIPGLSAYRKFRHYHNCRNGAKRLRKLIQGINFAPAIEVLRAEGRFGE